MKNAEMNTDKHYQRISNAMVPIASGRRGNAENTEGRGSFLTAFERCVCRVVLAPCGVNRDLTRPIPCIYGASKALILKDMLFRTLLL